MGLDMYLTRTSYVKNREHHAPRDRHRVTVLKGGVPRADIKPERIQTVVEEIAYWRKANAVHRWFVAHVQGHNDDCRPYPVTRGQLAKLVETCRRVLEKSELVPGTVKNGIRYENGVASPILEAGRIIKDATTAKRLMPTQSGFFFGSTDYDEYYHDALRDTVQQIEPVLSEPGDDYEYQASW